MGQWTLPGPDADVLTRAQVMALLHISSQTLDRMISNGEFPRGRKLSPQTAPIWLGVDLAAWMHLNGRMYSDKEAPTEKAEEENL